MTIKHIDNSYAIEYANDTRNSDLPKTVADQLGGEKMKLYRNTDERFGDTEVTFEIDDAVRGMKPILKQWAREEVTRGNYDSLTEAYTDMIAEFVAQCEEVE